MRSLIPITQEKRNENALKRSKSISDAHLLYILDEKVMERMERESSYVLDSETLKALERTLIESQRKEARAIAEEYGIENLYFEVGDYYDVVERYVLKLRPDIIMVDGFDRRFLSMGPLWVDSGNKIRTVVFHVKSLAKLDKVRKEISMLSEICERLGASLSIYTEIKEDSALRTLERLAPLTKSPDADMIAMQFFDKKLLHRDRSALIFEGIRKI